MGQNFAYFHKLSVGRLFIEFAENIPVNEPQVGHVDISIASSFSALTLSSAATTIALAQCALIIYSTLSDMIS